MGTVLAYWEQILEGPSPLRFRGGGGAHIAIPPCMPLHRAILLFVSVFRLFVYCWTVCLAFTVPLMNFLSKRFYGKGTDKTKCKFSVQDTPGGRGGSESATVHSECRDNSYWCEILSDFCLLISAGM